jgi:hypothetical protein
VLAALEDHLVLDLADGALWERARRSSAARSQPACSQPTFLSDAQSKRRARTEPQDDLLGRLGLLVEDGLRLSSVTGLLPVVTPLTLGEDRVLALLVLRDLVGGVLAALLALAVSPASLGNVDLAATENGRRRSARVLVMAGRDGSARQPGSLTTAIGT